MASCTSLFKEDAHTAINIRVGGTFTVVIVVITLFCEVQRTDLVQGSRMEFADLSCKSLIFTWGQWMDPAWNTWLEEKSSIRAHLMMIGQHIRHPFVIGLYPYPAFRQLGGKPIPVEIEPIVIGTPSWPDFMVFPVVIIRIEIHAPVGIRPVGKSLQAIRIKTWVHQDYGIPQHRFYFLPLSSRQIVSVCEAGIRTTGLITMNGKPLVNNNRHFLECRVGNIRLRDP